MNGDYEAGKRCEFTESQRRAYDPSAAAAIGLRWVKNPLCGIAVIKGFK
jgi:hypothetical protein